MSASPKQPTKEPTKEPAKEPTKEPAKDPAKAPAKASAKTYKGYSRPGEPPPPYVAPLKSSRVLSSHALLRKQICPG